MRAALGARLAPGWRERIGEELPARCGAVRGAPDGTGTPADR
jgi:hypothetical protein